MVKITNGVNVIEVTEGAYETIYKGLGFTPIDGETELEMQSQPNVEVEEVAQVDAISEDEAYCAQLLEKPIGQWNKNEVKSFARIKDIDLSGTTSAGEAKEIIKDFISEM